jgi:hypothetical protein
MNKYYGNTAFDLPSFSSIVASPEIEKLEELDIAIKVFLEDRG